MNNAIQKIVDKAINQIKTVFSSTDKQVKTVSCNYADNYYGDQQCQ